MNIIRTEVHGATKYGLGDDGKVYKLKTREQIRRDAEISRELRVRSDRRSEHGAFK